MKPKRAQVRSLPPSLDHSLSRPFLLGSYVQSPDVEKPFRALSNIPILQSQSAESKASFMELKAAAQKQKVRIQSLKAYKTALQQHHLARQSLLLTNETELMQLRVNASRTNCGGNLSQIDKITEKLAVQNRHLREIREKHLHEVELFKRSASERMHRGRVSGNSVFDIVLTQVELYETQLANKTEEEREAQKRYGEQLERIKTEKTEVRRELEEGMKARMKETAAMNVTKRKQQMLEDALSLRTHPRLVSDTAHQSAQALLTNLKLRLSLPLSHR